MFLNYRKTFVAVVTVMGFCSVIALNSATSNAQELTQTLIRPLNLHVSSKCVAGAAVFQVQNVGDVTVKSINFKLFKVGQKRIVSKRRMTLKQGQTATFKVKNAINIPDQIGLFVDSKFIVRTERADVAIQCSL